MAKKILHPSGKKRCPQCRRNVPIAKFSRKASTVDGLYGWCKECAAKKGKKYYPRANSRRRERRATDPQYAAKDRARSSAYLAKHREERKAYLRAWNQAHGKKWFKERYWQAPEQFRAKVRAYRAEHPEAVAKIEKRTRQKNWEAARARARAWRAKRRAIERQLPRDFKPADLRWAVSWWGDCCAVCKSPFSDSSWTKKLWLDHWVPLACANCPGTVPRNMIPLCGGCNKNKNDQEPAIWLRKKLGAVETSRLLCKIARFFATVRQTDG